MCGIFGGVGISPQQARQCIGAILRGDDGITVRQYDGAVFSSRRHLVKESHKKDVGDGESDQPYESADGSIALVFNGELYDFEDVKSRLGALGHTFETDGDTEVFLRLYEEYGAEFIAREDFDALFALGILDQSTGDSGGRLIITRDWPGRVPLFYYYDRETRVFLFSSELKGYRPLPWMDLAKPIELKPGTIASLDLESFELSFETFFRPAPVKRQSGLKQVGQELHGLLMKAGRNRTMGDVPICTMLSGGIDSVMSSFYVFDNIDFQKASFQPVSYVYQIDDYVSEDVRRAVAAAEGFSEIGLELKIIKSPGRQLIEDIPHIIELFEMRNIRALSVYPLPIYYYLAPEMRRDGFKVTVGGHGVDELLGAYDSWKELDKSHAVQVDVRSRLAFINAIYENMMRRASIIFMNRGPIEARFPFLCPEVCNYMLGIDARWMSLTPATAEEFLELVSSLGPGEAAWSDQLAAIQAHLVAYLDGGGGHPEAADEAAIVEIEKLFWKLPLIVAGMHAAAGSWLDFNVIFNAKLRGQHGSGITSLETDIVARYRDLGADDAEIFKSIADAKFRNRGP